VRHMLSTDGSRGFVACRGREALTRIWRAAGSVSGRSRGRHIGRRAILPTQWNETGNSGGDKAWLVAKELAQANVPVILNPPTIYRTISIGLPNA